MSLPVPTLEANFDGLVGPTHNYGGLSYGNVASSSNSARPSNPKQAAQQDFDEDLIYDDMVTLPNYCSYIHVAFWGQMFSPELTYSPNGFIIRRRKATDLQMLTAEF